MMKSVSGFSDLKKRRSIRIALLAASSLFILSTSIFFYSRIILQKTLNVGGTVTTGPGPAAVSIWAIPVIAFSAVGMTLMLFALLREAFKHLGHGGQVSLATNPVPAHSADEWEESPKKDASE